MIGKIPRPGRGFRGSFQYLMHGKRDADRDVDRLAWMETRNLFVKDMDKIPSMMRATAAQSKKCQKPVYHMIISWRPDEPVSDVTMREVADQALFDLGLNEHQAVLAAHRDTDHRHLHILVNRVHPETGKAWHTSKDWARLERSIARQALERGLVMVEGRHNAPEQMQYERKRARDCEFQMAKRLGREVQKARWPVEEFKSRRLQLAPIFDQSRSWDQLSRLLSAEGLTLTAKGQGLIIDDGMGFMKLSDLGKDVRLEGLEKLYRERFSDFDRRRGMERKPTDETTPTPREERHHRGRKPPPNESAAEDGSTTQNARCHKPDIERETDKNAHENLGLDEEHKEAFRKKWRLRRLAEHPRSQPSWPATGSSDEDLPQQHAAGAAKQLQAEPSPRQNAIADVVGANQRLNLSRKLHEMGLISKQDLIRAQSDLKIARQELSRHQTFSEFVGDGIRDALASVGNPSQPPPQAKPTPRLPKPAKPLAKRRKDEDRER